MFPTSKATLEARDKARGFTPMGISEMASSSEAAVRCNKKHVSLASSAGSEVIPTQKTMPPLRHGQLKRSRPVLHLPRHGASRKKQAVLSVTLKGRHRRGSTPMSICGSIEQKLLLYRNGVPDRARTKVI